jgi:hypothetical protein
MDLALVDRASQQFLDQWKRLVSTTNWDKGHIICNWREALRASGAPGSEYSDEAWSRRVGNVTPQHVGRLRRAFERFGQVREDYPGLYWTHFQAALDWDDAEMWLEGAVQSDWSISEMRHQRWQANGGAEGQEPRDDETNLASPWDDDAEPQDAADEVVSGTMGVVTAPERSRDGKDGNIEAEREEGYDHSQFEDDQAESGRDRAATTTSPEAFRPFADLPPLPADVNDAFEAYKLCILRHRLAGWQEISRDDMVASLASLQQLALAPADA